MATRFLPALLIVICAISVSPGLAQQAPEPDKKQIEAIQKTQSLLDKDIVETKYFQKEMPLGDFLEALQKRLPKEMKLNLRIDKDAFSGKFPDVAAWSVSLPKNPQLISLRRALEIALSKINTKVDYRLGAGAVVITTPERALYTVVYDIGDIIERPESWARFFESAKPVADLRKRDPAERAAILVQALVKEDAIFPGFPGWSVGVGNKPIHLVNGTSLSVQSNAAKHAQIAEVLASCRRLMDVKVLVQTKLFEVDETFYKSLKPTSLKRLSLEEWEQLFWDGKIDQSLWKTLEKQKPIVIGKDVILDHGLAAPIMSQHHVRTLLPSPAQVRQGEKGPQSILEGFSITAGAEVRNDRRGVRVTWTEKITELQGIEKAKVLILPEDKYLPAEIAYVKDTTFTQACELGDGDGILLAVNYRPKSAQQKDRWLVLALWCRLIIQEEEELEFRGHLGWLLPDLVADVLKNPLLKNTRDFYGSPADKRFALVDSETWKWSPASQPTIAGFQVTPAKNEGQRLLGIRVDKYEPASKENAADLVTLTLFNAGGSANGAVVGGCTVRFQARRGEDVWKIEILPDGP